jgi:hypothetical protein
MHYISFRRQTLKMTNSIIFTVQGQVTYHFNMNLSNFDGILDELPRKEQVRNSLPGPVVQKMSSLILG